MFDASVTLEKLNAAGVGNMSETLGIQFTAVGERFMEATMPVDARTKQPMGLLHGGASVALAETLGSMASGTIVAGKSVIVGLEINANHLRAKREGFVTGRVEPIHVGRRTHVWDVRIRDEAGALVCVSRLTVAILEKGTV